MELKKQRKKRLNSLFLLSVSQHSYSPHAKWLETAQEKGVGGDRCVQTGLFSIYVHLFPVKYVTQFRELCSCLENRLE